LGFEFVPGAWRIEREGEMKREGLGVDDLEIDRK